MSLFGGLVRWDAGTSDARDIPGGFLTADYFTVPLDAPSGAHPIQIYSGTNRSAMFTFTVSKGVRRPRPRIDDITCRNFTITGKTSASFFLLVHCANADAGAQVVINGVPQSTALWRAKLNEEEMAGLDPATLGYPIFHYSTLICGVSGATAGDTIRNITVRNLGGEVSVNSSQYGIAANLQVLDSDGDGLTDVEETNGIDANNDGTIDINLPAIGCNSLHKDILLEADWMRGCAPRPGLWAYAENVYRNAPVMNSDGTPGVHLHIDHGQGGPWGTGGNEVPYADGVLYPGHVPNASLPAGTTLVNFQTIKRDHFDPKKLRYVRYCLFANMLAASPTIPGQAENEWSNDVIICARENDYNRSYFERMQIGVFLHEFGHTMGLHHGGSDQVRRKPNYNSIMNNDYNYMGVDVDGDPFNFDTARYTYSHGMRRPLDERCLRESEGLINNIPVDWNRNSTIEAACVTRNLTEYDTVTTIIYDRADWPYMKYSFTAPGSLWNNN
jgi:hypothetical protein